MRRASTLLGIAMCLLGSAPVLADTGTTEIIGFGPQILKVHANGETYHKLDLLGNAAIAVNLQYDTEASGRIKSWWVEPVMETGVGLPVTINLASLKPSASYPVGGRPKSIKKTLSFAVPKHKIEGLAVAMCNAHLGALRQTGKSTAQILKQTHTVHFVVSVKGNVDATFSGLWPLHQAAVPTSYTVKCLKWSGARIPTVGGLKNPKYDDGTGHWKPAARQGETPAKRLKLFRN